MTLFLLAWLGTGVLVAILASIFHWQVHGRFTVMELFMPFVLLCGGPLTLLSYLLALHPAWGDRILIQRGGDK